MNTPQIKRGEIYYADLDPTQGSEQDGFRPVLIVQNDVGNVHSPTTQIVPLTTQFKKKNQPTHVLIPKSSGPAVGSGLESNSLALAEQLRTIDKLRLGDYIGRISAGEQAAVDSALAVSVGLEAGV